MRINVSAQVKCNPSICAQINGRYHKFSILPGDALCTLEEVFDVFVNILGDLTFDKETFKALQMRVGVL